MSAFPAIHRGPYSSQYYNTTLSPQYPTSWPNVVSVGGTTLTVGGSNPHYTYGAETAWGNGVNSGSQGGGGGGISAYESQPAYQNGVVSAFSTTQRTYPDVSADADPNSGVAVYDSWDFGTSTPWLPGYLGGTSLATPLWAGIIAVADKGRAVTGQGSLDGRSQALPERIPSPGPTPRAPACRRAAMPPGWMTSSSSPERPSSWKARRATICSVSMPAAAGFAVVNVFGGGGLNTKGQGPVNYQLNYFGNWIGGS